ncbi:MAG: hypothetical protein DMD81_07695 [Candidatus Rokuibacteriota bacterium]|nr:MAG: hypothetical protein DMD81_07695 [Candidatus Rokubacteria bacterium]
MIENVARVLASEEDVAYALIFGSTARGRGRPGSDIDVALGLRAGASRDAHALGGLAARLESADGTVILDRDHRALVTRKARAILEYLDFKPIEDRCAAGVLRAAARGR